MAACPLQFQPPAVIRETESTRMVKSVVLTGHGGIQNIKVIDAPLPNDLKDYDVEVEVHYCGMNFTDNYLRLGIVRSNTFPVVMGSECSGIVRRIGSEVTEVKVGDKVLCIQMQGGLFRHVVHVDQKYCFQVPERINLCHAVCLGLNFLVAHLCLFELGNLKTTQIVFMQAIAGGVGTAVIQLARTVPLVRVLGTASEFKHEQIRNLGVNRAYRDSDDYVQQVLKLYPEGVDLVINSNGGSDVDKCTKMLRPCGKLLNIGSNNSIKYSRYTLWTWVKPSWDVKSVSCSEMIRNTYSVAGLNIGKLLEMDRLKIYSLLMDIFELYTHRKITPRAHNVLSFERVAYGMNQLCGRRNYGKVVLSVKESAVEPLTELADVA